MIFGRLFGRHHADRLVVLYHHLAGLRGRFSPVQSTRTDAGGAYEFTRADGRVDTNRSWFVAAAGAHSRVLGERVAALVSLAVTGPGGVPEPDGSVLQTGPGFTYTFAGTVDPGRPGALVVLQRQGGNNGEDWATIGRGTLDANGNYSIPHVFVFPSSDDGSANVRILMRNDVRNIASASDPLSYEIEQTQNPNLTINAAANPIVEGQADIVKGIDAQGARPPAHPLGSHGAPRLHRARHDGDHRRRRLRVPGDAGLQHGLPRRRGARIGRLRCVEDAMAGARSIRDLHGLDGDDRLDRRHRGDGRHRLERRDGEHRLDRRSGTTGATGTAVPRGSRDELTSAVLFVGVRVSLSAQSTPTTVNQGQSVTFSGQVVPDKTGRAIYLQEQNAGGVWHAIAVARIGPNSSYQITQAFYEPGTVNVRVKVPGGPDNQGSVSQVFAITVNAVPASSLVPAGG